ncbi:MAG: Cys-tRNA(Pro) deacylase [Anaerolineae bacterium]|nr:Cys-tRNA(Pro) deacylase [Anaerolineae bacterium]
MESKGIPYQALEVPVKKLGAMEIAALLAVPFDQVYKTIVVKRISGKPILAVVPGSNAVDLKLLAGLLEEKKIILSSQDEAEQITALKVGGISPLALINKGFSVIIDAHCHAHSEIIISGGQRGLMIQLAPTNLIRLTTARTGTISRPKT